MAEEDEKNRGRDLAREGARLLNCRRRDEAFKLFEEGAKTGDKESIFYLAVCYGRGWGAEKDEKLCVEILRKALDETGDANFKTELARCYLTGCGVERSLDAFISLTAEAADEGFPPAQRTLAMYKLYGEGVERDVDGALQLFCDAAAAGEPNAMYELMSLCRNGMKEYCPFGVRAPVILTAAQKEKAASGALYIGKEYNAGHILPMWRAGAKRWFELAAVRGNAEAMYELVHMYGQYEEDPWHSMDEALKWLRSSIDKGYPPAFTLLGYFHMKGIGVKKDKKKAREWLERGLAAGDGNAEKYLKELDS